MRHFIIFTNQEYAKYDESCRLVRAVLVCAEQKSTRRYGRRRPAHKVFGIKGLLDKTILVGSRLAIAEWLRNVSWSDDSQSEDRRQHKLAGPGIEPVFSRMPVELFATALHRPVLSAEKVPTVIITSNELCFSVEIFFYHKGAAVVKGSDISPPPSGSIPGGVTPVFLHVVFVPDDEVGLRVFSGISRFPALEFQCCSILTSLHPHWLSRPRYATFCRHLATLILTVNAHLDRDMLAYFPGSSLMASSCLPFRELPSEYNLSIGSTVREAVMAERLPCSPPTKVNRIQSPAGSLLDFRMWGSCRTISLVGGFSRGSTFSPPFHSGAAQYTPQSPSSAFTTSLLRADQIASRPHQFPTRYQHYNITYQHYNITYQHQRTNSNAMRDRLQYVFVNWVLNHGEDVET
ncbi:hypothetical protein PR048_024034 [Dryococelus australis]|uniref:Uncharacterized protein n=1 Tax=Dryococelus australis TaxID=614101 RepID=A0ABQ9GVR5_9NEOP|nr:hypothetical protein PR048_024034 [Dryococelus australis]